MQFIPYILVPRRNPAYKGGEAGEGGAKRVVSPFMCPITEHGFDGKHRFVVVRATGHVVAEKALKELPQLVEELVGSAVEGKDVIVLNGTEQERAQYAEVRGTCSCFTVQGWSRVDGTAA